MKTPVSIADRRRFIQGLTLGMAAFSAPGLFAQQLAETATTTEGPFYPDKLPLDTDNDLLIINDAHHAGGRRDHAPDRPRPRRVGQPVRNAVVEIWQCDNNGVLPAHQRTVSRQAATATSRASAASSPARRASTTSARSSRSSTRCMGIFRTAHIHVALSKNGKRLFTTQMLVNGHPGNARDTLTMRMEKKALQTILVDFKPMAGLEDGGAHGQLRHCPRKDRR